MTRIATYEQAVALGIADHWPSDLPRTAPLSRDGNAVTPGRRPRVRAVNELGQNKTEAAFDALLAERRQAGAIEAYAFEPFKWRLAARTWLTVDFAVWTRGRLLVVDTKGSHVEDDAAVKYKVFAEKYPLVPLYLAFRGHRGRGWDFKVVDRRSGIVPCDGRFLGLADGPAGGGA